MKKTILISLLVLAFCGSAWGQYNTKTMINTGRTTGLSTDCSTYIDKGQLCYDTDDLKLYVGNGTAAVENSASGAISTDTLWDAAGDLAVGTGANTGGRLAIGTAYQLLHVNSTTPGWTSTLGATGTRLTKGWFTDIDVTTVTAGSVTVSPSANPTLTFSDSDEAPGTAKIYGNNSSSDNAITMSLGVEIADGTENVDFIQLVGTGTGTISLLKPVTASGQVTFSADPRIYDGDSHHLTLGVADLSGDATILFGGTFTNTKWCSYATTTGLTCNQDAPAGSGDVTAVGDCNSGDCTAFVIGGISLGDTTPDADGEIGYASNAYTIFANSEDMVMTASANLWTFSSGSSATFAFTPAVALNGGGTVTTALNPVSADGATLGTTALEWSDLFLADGGIIYGQNDQSATLTSSASLWTANNFAVTTQFKLPSTDADPTATAGYMRHDSSNTSASGGGLLAWHDGTNIRQIVDTGTTFTQITKFEYLPIRYAEDDDSVTAPAAAAEIGTTTLIARSFAEDADNGVVFWWQIPSDWVSGFKYRVYYAIDTNASADETVAFALSGCSVGNSDAIACSEGTAVTVTDELSTDEDTGELLISDWSTAVTITNAAVGEFAKLLLIRDVSEDDAAGHTLVVGIEIKYVGKIAPFSAY